MKLTRQVQFWKRGERDWDAPMVVDDFQWEEPDALILDAKGEVIRRVRVSATGDHWGWRGGTVWIPE